ncbi:MAG: HAMP domain-containing protein, partial [Candidatus Hydrogenedentes bacterium]|nr:HAMP domain-containing protein [Candidatus Hydrogenedentota bacterium]
RIAILEDDDVFIDVATGGESAEAFDKETALVLLNRLKANPDEHVLQERTGDTLSIITTFVPARPQKVGALIVQFPFRTARAVVLPQILHLTTSTLLVLLLAVWLALRMSRSVSRPLSDLVDVASTYATGDLTKRAEEEGPVEVATLGRAFNRMAASIEDQIEKLKTETARREQLEGELRIAAELQQSLLPEAARTTYGPVEIVGTCEAAREVGGGG